MAYTPALVALISAVLAKALATLSIADPPDMVFAKANAELAYMPAELAAANADVIEVFCVRFTPASLLAVSKAALAVFPAYWSEPALAVYCFEPSEN